MSRVGLVPVDGGVRLAVQDLGGGPALVLLAGWGLSHQVWQRQVQRLHRSFRTLAIDLRGHGDSDAPVGDYSIRQHAADVAEVLRALGVRHAAVVGWSMGGQVAFRLAAENPDLVRRLVLVSTNAVRASRADHFPFGAPAETFLPGLLAGETGPGWVEARREMIETGMAGPARPALVDWLLGVQSRMPTWAGAACFADMFVADATGRIPAVTVPTLLVGGTADRVFSRRGAAWLAGELADARYAELDGCGHFPMFERAGDFDRIVEGFLSAR